MKNIGIIIGHSEIEQGSIAYSGVSEFEYNSKVAEIVKELLQDYDCNVQIYTKQGLNYAPICEKYRDDKPDMSIELHFNSYKKVARGLEVLILHKSDIFIADRLSSLLSDELGISERRGNGVLLLKDSDRGAICLREVSKYCQHALLVEPCFANTRNPDSIKLFENDTGMLFYAKALVSSIVECLGISKTDSLSDLEYENIQLRGILSKIKQLVSC